MSGDEAPPPPPPLPRHSSIGRQVNIGIEHLIAFLKHHQQLGATNAKALSGMCFIRSTRCGIQACDHKLVTVEPLGNRSVRQNLNLHLFWSVLC